MVTGLNGAEGALIDPVTGDFLFSTFGSGNEVFKVTGFGSLVGCTDPEACNYDQTAVEDDDSCVFAEEVCEVCNEDGTVGLAVAEAGAISYPDDSESQFICLGDGIEVFVDLEGQDASEGVLFQWVITDSDLNILGLPETPPFVFDEAGEGVCLIWHLAFDPDNSNVLDIISGENPNAGNIEG